jgi:TonB family protein
VLWVKFDRLDKIDISFGEIEIAFEEDMIEGGAATEGVEGAQSNQTPDDAAVINDVTPIASQNSQPAPEVPVSGTNSRPTETTSNTTPTEPDRVVNQDALFSANATSSGSGTSATSASTGSGSGTTGAGYSDNDFSLEGRSPVGGLIKPSYERQQAGRLVVEIWVDGSGRVTYAEIKEGNITNSTLRNAALSAARSTKFTQSNESNQRGTITYIFKLQ